MKIIRYVALAILDVSVVATQAFAVWPPSTALTEGTSSLIYGLIIVVFAIGIAIGIWSQRNRHEHK